MLGSWTWKIRVRITFKLHICNLGTEIPVEKEVELGVLDTLQQGEYLLNMGSRIIVNINDFTTPLYSVIIEATESSEYGFEELED